MLEAIKKEANYTHTENGALTHATSGSDCLDLFAAIGALRKAPQRTVIQRFMRAYTEDPDLAMKLLFFSRDIRGGLGERKVFRIILRWLAENHPDSVRKNLARIPEFGRWDDVLVLMDTPCEDDAVDLIWHQLETDLASADMGGDVSLLAKWLPSVNASSEKTVKLGKRLARQLGYNDVQYRKILVKLRGRIRIIENNLRQMDYTFDYSKQPSRAMFKYRKAFHRNDRERYVEFLQKVQAGEATLHADTLMPYELVDPYLLLDQWTFNRKSYMRDISQAEKDTLNATWASLPDFGSGENALAVIDTSGSMYGVKSPTPASVALSLGLYFAEHNRGIFRNHFITFSERPQLIEVKGETFADRLAHAASFSEVANTNIQKVFELILKAAVKHRIPQEEMPQALYIISDMEFDRCTRGAELTNFEYAKKLFAKKGYRLPRVVFWNVASRNAQQPVTKNEQGVALVSGCTPRLFSMVADGQLSPLGYMLEVLGSDRYAAIAA